MTNAQERGGVPPLSRSSIDRDDLRRAQPDAIAALAADPDARAVSLVGGRFRVDGDELLLPRLGAAAGEPLAYLGRVAVDGDATAPVVLVVEDAEASPDDAGLAALRSVGHRFSDRDAGLMTEALALANWHAAATHCPRCGALTSVGKAGWSRDCPACGDEIFPRTDPAVIVAVLDADDRVLLGSNALWEHGRFSLLAGFVEAGESLEAAVVREVGEEAGVRVGPPRYLASQPWPFPRSLMFGFEVSLADDADPADTVPDGEEIVELRWFDRETIRAGDGITLPGPTSIAHAVLDAWLRRDGGPGLADVDAW